MKKQLLKPVLFSMLILSSVGVIAGCGSNQQVGYVDSEKIMQQTQKGQDIGKAIEAKRQALNQKVEAAAANGEAAQQQAIQEAQQEWAAFGQAEQNEIQKLIDENVSTVAKEKNINVVLKKAAVTSGGVDLTDDVINKVGKAPSTDTAKASDTQTK